MSMVIHPLLAIIDAPIIIGILVIGALLFGAEKLPKLARSAGQAKKEFMMGQLEADEAAARAREEMRLRSERQHADAMDGVEAGGASGQPVPPPTPGTGTPSS
jgi:TatA/E family protein of Tat protein translocase